jgi:hypothetical protein
VAVTAAGRPGARVVFTAGTARLAPARPVPGGWEPALASVVSPGTELRQLTATTSGPSRTAGYMTLARRGDGLQLAPVPHGAPVPPWTPRSLAVPAGTPAERVAIARFQLMAALGLAAHVPAIQAADRVLVTGSGPVATGCALELRRLGTRQVTIATRHPSPAAAGIPGTVITTPPGPAWAVVIECTGHAVAGLELTSPGGLLGLLGTPGDSEGLPAAAVHRAGVTIAGMHELAGYDAARYQDAFTTVLEWVTLAVADRQARSWCRRVPGEDAPGLYARLQGPGRPPEPFLILDWSTP